MSCISGTSVYRAAAFHMQFPPLALGEAVECVCPVLTDFGNGLLSAVILA